MLFTDGQFITSADLQIVDAEITNVASTEKITLDGPGGLIMRSLTELGADFLSKIQNFSGYLVGLGVNYNQQAAVMNILSTAINRPRALLNQIPVIEPNPTRCSFRRWAEYYCLVEFYQSLSFRKQNDRYEKKMNMFDKKRKQLWQILRSNGFPILLTPIPCPGATLEYGSGRWTAANQAGTSADPGQKWDIAVTYVVQPGYVSPTNQAGCESAGSAIATVQTSPGGVIAIDITGLNPPAGVMPVAIGTAAGIYPVVTVTGWNLYIGKSGSKQLALQNASPIPIGTKTYTLPDIPQLTGAPLNAGQPAQYDFSFQDMVWRA